MEQPISEERITSLRRSMKKYDNWTDEELDIITPKNWRMLDSEHKMRQYKVIAEVVRINDHCELKAKVGDKYVFTGTGILIPEESTFPGMCLWSLAGIYPLGFTIVDRIISGADPNEIWRDRATCLGPTLRDGGLGNVVFGVYCEKV